MANSLLWWSYVKACWRSFISKITRKNITFKATAKGGSKLKNSPLRDIWLAIVMFVLLTISIAVAIWQLVDGALVFSPLLISVLWAAYAIVPPFLLLFYTVIGPGLLLQFFCRYARASRLCPRIFMQACLLLLLKRCTASRCSWNMKRAWDRLGSSLACDCVGYGAVRMLEAPAGGSNPVCKAADICNGVCGCPLQHCNACLLTLAGCRRHVPLCYSVVLALGWHLCLDCLHAACGRLTPPAKDAGSMAASGCKEQALEFESWKFLVLFSPAA